MRILVLIVIILIPLKFFGQKKNALIHDAYQRVWYTHVPSNYSKEKAYPLVIVLHGGGGTAKQLMKHTKGKFNRLADQEGFIVVYPDGLKNSWNDNPNRDTHGFARKENIDDVGFIEKMIHQIESNYNIDPKAIFACGISNGGLMSQSLAMELPEKIRGIGMVASNFGRHQVEESENVQPFPILIIHGTADTIIPYSEGTIRAMGSSRGPVLGVEKSIEYMCALNGNSGLAAVSEVADLKNDGCISKHYIYPNDQNPNLRVELIRIEGGGHTWPGARSPRLISRIVGKTTRDFNASTVLWDFFKRVMK